MTRRLRNAAKAMISALRGLDADEQMFLENDYLLTENLAWRTHFKLSKQRLNIGDGLKAALAEKGKLLGNRIYDVAHIVTPGTLLRWHRELVAMKFDSSRSPRRSPGRPATEAEIEQNILKFAQENKTWGYDKIAGALRNIGLVVCPSTVANVMKRNGLNPSGDRKKGGMSWAEFLKIQKDAIWATDFLTSEVWTPFGLTTFYILFFIQIKTRKVVLGGITAHPTGDWMAQVAKNLTGFDGELAKAKYLIHDRDTKYTAQFGAILKGAGVKPVKLPAFSPNLNAYAERFVLSLKTECLEKFIPVGEKSLRRAVRNYLEHYHSERNHQGIGNCIPFPEGHIGSREGKLKTRSRLGGLLKYYYRDQEAA